MSVVYQTFEQDIKTRLSNGSSVEDVLVFYKHFDQSKIMKIISKINKPIEEKKPKQPKKVNRIDPKDERVKGMELGSYANVLGGVRNNYFWQCAKCNKIYQQREEAIYCFDMVGSIKEIQANQKIEIGTINQVTIKGQKYKCEILEREINDSYMTQFGMHDSRWDWYYNKQRQYMYKVKVLEEI